jgi:hypothetical protein
MRLPFGNPAAHAWERGFLHHLETELHRASQQGLRDLLERIQVTAQTRFDTHCPTVPDMQGRGIVGRCSLILAAYREMNAALGDEDAARDLVKSAMFQSYKTFGEWMNRLLL